MSEDKDLKLKAAEINMDQKTYNGIENTFTSSIFTSYQILEDGKVQFPAED